MSIEPESPAAPTGGLQFDRAEFDGSVTAMGCTGCQRPIADQYYDIDGSPFCPACRDGVEAYLTGGSRAGRLARAVAFGGATALVAASVYFAFIHFSGMDWSLISVLVGLMVGTAVHKGSRSRGGLPYQLIAVALTYVSISITYMAFEISLWDQPDPAAAGNNVAPAPENVAEGLEHVPPEDIIGFIVRTFLLVPLMHSMDSPITALIVGFALWEAWRLNAPTRVAISGPYRVGGKPGGLAADAPAHA